MKKFSLIFILVYCVNLSLSSQNLVPNPSFEDTLTCPDNIGDLTVVSWYKPTTANPDYFHSCNNGNVSVPQNAFGWQNARTGNAYVGGHTSNFTATDYREYVQCQLNSELQDGELYEVSFYVTRADSSTKACDNIGAYLSIDPVTSNNGFNLPFTPQVVSPANVPITDDIDWVQIIDTITANGGEKYLTLGIFSNNENTNWITVTGGWEEEAHYYYDDVSLIHISPNSIVEFEETNLLIYPNPSGGVFNISSDILIQEYNVFSSLGALVASDQVNACSFSLNHTGFRPGIYFAYMKMRNQIIRKKLILN